MKKSRDESIAQSAVGYSKSIMLFHMLSKTLGEKIFLAVDYKLSALRGGKRMTTRRFSILPALVSLEAIGDSSP